MTTASTSTSTGDRDMAYSYGIPDGTYVGRPTTASCYEKDGRLILDVRFMVRDPASGEWYKNDKGYDWEVLKRHWLTSRDGAFNERTIAGLREWAKGWDPRSFDDFYWFQSPDEGNVAFGHLAAVGEVELNFTTGADGSQSVWVHDPNRPRPNGRGAYVPAGASADRASMSAKWGTKAKALFAATPRKVAPASGAAPSAAPSRQSVPSPAATPSRPAPEGAEGDLPWAGFPQTAEGAFRYFCSLLGEPYSGAKHDDRWFALFDGVAGGKDPDTFAPDDVQRLFRAVRDGMAG